MWEWGHPLSGRNQCGPPHAGSNHLCVARNWSFPAAHILVQWGKVLGLCLFQFLFPLLNAIFSPYLYQCAFLTSMRRVYFHACKSHLELLKFQINIRVYSINIQILITKMKTVTLTYFIMGCKERFYCMLFSILEGLCFGIM